MHNWKMLFVITAILVLFLAPCFAGDLTPLYSGSSVTQTVEGAYSFTSDVAVDSKYVIVGGDASTGLMALSASITAPNQALVTNAFAVTFNAAPIVTATYTEDPGDVRPIFVSAVTASNVVFGITADKNYTYQAIGARP